MKTKSSKAQAETVSFLLISLLVIIMVLTAFVWGSGVLDERKESYNAVRMKTKMLEMREAILNVAQDGENATKVLSVSIDRGKVYLDTSFIPVVCGQQRRDNGIIYEVDTKEEIVNSENWVNYDPYENESGDLCTTGGPSLSYPAVLFARSIGQGEKGKYTTQYLLSFRNLKDAAANEHHIIRIGTSAIGQYSTGIGEGTHVLMVRNEGSTYDDANFRWTHNIALIFDP